MDQDVLILATIDLASSWKAAGSPRKVLQPCLGLKPSFTAASFCPDCGNLVKDSDPKDEQRRQLNSLLIDASEAVLPGWPGMPGAQAKVERRGKQLHMIEVPWARTGSGSILLFEALVMALARQITVKRAAALLRRCDDRLWRVIDAGPDAPDQRLCRALGLWRKDAPNIEIITAKAADGAARTGAARDPGLTGMSKALALIILDALLRAAEQASTRSPTMKDTDRGFGKISAEEGMLYPGQSRAPPK